MGSEPKRQPHLEVQITRERRVMSYQATQATWAHTDTLRQSLRAVPEHRRPSFERAFLVAAYLADKHQAKRGYVDETIAQISEVTLQSIATVKNVLRALDDIGWWVVQSSGNRHQAARRKPLFLRLEGEVDLADENPDPESQTASSTQPPSEPVDNSRGLGTDTYTARYGGLEGEVDLAHPLFPLSTPTTPLTPLQGGNDDELAAYGLGPSETLIDLHASLGAPR